MRLNAARVICAISAAAALVVLPAAAQATTWQVNTTNYPGGEKCTPSECSLRAAVEAANAGSGADVVDVPAGTYKLNGLQLAITKGMQIVGTAGAGETKIDAHTASGIFDILETVEPVSISGLTLENGEAPGGGGAVDDSVPQQLTLSDDIIARNGGNGIRGGGAVIVNAGGPAALTVTNSSFLENAAGGAGGSTTQSGEGAGGGIEFESDTGTLTITGSRFLDNTAGGAGGTGQDSGLGGGGAIFFGWGVSATITDSSFSGNRAGGDAGSGLASGVGFGGALEFAPAGESSLIITGSLFQENESGGSGSAESGTGIGGALLADQVSKTTTASATLIDDTFALNNANHGKGGGYAGAAPSTLINDTFSENAAGAGEGGNLDVLKGAMAIKNTIVADGSAATGSNCSFESGSLPFVSEGNNLEDTTPSQCGLGATGDLVGVAPLLGALQSNGGPTDTEALLPGSPAIDAGDDNGCPASDQRGVLRPAGAACDIGAYEVATAIAVTEPASGLIGSSATLNGSFTNPDLAAGTVTFQYGTTTAYGSQTPAQAIGPVTAGAPFSAGLTGLSVGTGYHFRAVIANGLGTVYGADHTFKVGSTVAITTTTTTTTTIAPQLSSLAITPSTIHPYPSSGASLAVKHEPKGATISYRDSEAATTTLLVQRPVSGYRSGAKCLSHRPAHHHGALHRCKLFVKVGSFTHLDTAGLNQLHFTARINGRPLHTGRYRLRATATNASGQTSTPLMASFSLV